MSQTFNGINGSPIRVICVDDHFLIVEALRTIIEREKDIRFVAAMNSADSIVQKVKETDARIVTMDIQMPGPDPFEAVADLARQCERTRVIMLSGHILDHFIESAVGAGAWGFLSKDEADHHICDAIRRVAKGEFVFGPAIQARFNDPSKPEAIKIKSLTPREQQVLRMIGKGMSRFEIAKQLCRSPKTIDAHRAAIMLKLDIHDRTELAIYAIREGLVPV